MRTAEPGRGEDERLVDARQVRNVVGFTLRSLGRHKLLALAAFAAVTTSAAAIYQGMPQRYRARATIQVSQNPLMPAMVNPRRYYTRDMGPSPESALKSAISQQFLLGLIDKHELVDHWRANRSSLQRARDKVLESARGPLSHEEERAIMLGTLESRLQVEWKGDGVADISISWPEPAMAQTLVAEVQERFLQARREQQVDTARGAIGVLEGAVANARTALDEALVEVVRHRERLRKGSKPSSIRGMQAEGRWRQMPDAELVRLRTEILARRSAISALEGQRRQRLAAVEAEVAELESTYGSGYPTLADARGRLSALRGQSPEVTALRDEEQRLLQDFVDRGGKATDLVEMPTASFPAELEDGDPKLAHAREQLRLATNRYADIADRLQTARLELNVAEAGFDDGYAVVRAAAVPIRPERASLKKLGAAAMLGGLFAALFAALFMDLRKGTLLEKWQVEKAVGAPVLSEVERR